MHEQTRDQPSLPGLGAAMTYKKAAEILLYFATTHPTAFDQDFYDALKLAIKTLIHTDSIGRSTVL